MKAPRPQPEPDWDVPIDAWRATRPATLLRAYSDAVNIALVERWLPARPGRVLKTDLFDEAVGAGLYASLSRRCGDVVGVDVSAQVIAAARARLPELEAVQGDVRALPFGDESFDVVVSNSTLDHFASRADVAASLGELRRVLRPGGHLLVSFDNAGNPLVAVRNALPEAFRRRSRLVPYPVGVTAGPRGLRRLLAGAGFAVERAAAVMHFPRVVGRLCAVAFPAGPLLRTMLAFERLERLPTRSLTAQFAAALARRV